MPAKVEVENNFIKLVLLTMFDTALIALGLGMKKSNNDVENQLHIMADEIINKVRITDLKGDGMAAIAEAKKKVREMRENYLAMEEA